MIPVEGGYQLYDPQGNACFPQPISAKLMSRGIESDYFIWHDDTKKELFVTDDTGTLLFEPIQNFDIGLTYEYYSHRPPECIYREGVLNLAIERGKSVALDEKGNQLFEKSFEELKPAGEGLIPFLEYGKWGYVDFSGNIVVEAQYEDALTFSEGLAAVTVNGEVGFIDKSGTMVIQPQFSTEYNTTLLGEKCTFKNGFAAVAIDKVTGALIDRTGACVIQAQGSSRFLYDPTGFVSIYYGETSNLYKVTQS